MASSHDDCVRKRARELEQDGYSVKADIPGYEQPDGTDGPNRAIPDIDATDLQGWRKRRIEEVETRESMTKPEDVQQRKKLKEYAKHNDAEFETHTCAGNDDDLP